MLYIKKAPTQACTGVIILVDSSSVTRDLSYTLHAMCMHVPAQKAFR